jgi:Kef-type K+ transport system membrane component KefB
LISNVVHILIVLNPFRLKLIWKYAEPFLFPVIGASVSLAELPFWTLLTSITAIIMSMLVKMGATFLTAKVAGLTPDEQLFTCGIWTGKGSVQVCKVESSDNSSFSIDLASSIL